MVVHDGLNRVVSGGRGLCVLCMGFYFGGTENQQSSWHTEAEETTTEPLFRGWPCSSSHWGFRGLPSPSTCNTSCLLASFDGSILIIVVVVHRATSRSNPLPIRVCLCSDESCFDFYHSITCHFWGRRNIFLVQPVHVAKIVMIIFWNNKKKSEFFSERKQKEIYFGWNQI